MKCAYRQLRPVHFGIITTFSVPHRQFMGDINGRFFFQSKLIKYLNKRKVNACDNSWTGFNCSAFLLPVNMNYSLCVDVARFFFFGNHMLFCDILINLWALSPEWVVCLVTHINRHTAAGQRIYFFIRNLLWKFIKCACSFRMFINKYRFRQCYWNRFHVCFRWCTIVDLKAFCTKSHYWAIITKQVDERLKLPRFFCINIAL